MSVTKTTAQIVTAATTLAALAASSVNPENKSGALDDIRLVFERARTVYLREASVAVVKTISGANAAALFAAATIADGLVFKVAGTTDTTDTALATAKGSAPAADDVFQRSGSAIVYVGTLNDVTGLDAVLVG